MKKAIKRGQYVQLQFNDGGRAGFYLSGKESERTERRLENYKKNDANRFFEVDTVLAGVLVLNLEQVRSARIESGLFEAKGMSPSEKLLSVHYAGEPIPEQVNCAEKEDIHLLANMLVNTDALDSHFVFVESDRGWRHFFPSTTLIILCCLTWMLNQASQALPLLELARVLVRLDQRASAHVDLRSVGLVPIHKSAGCPIVRSLQPTTFT